MTLKTVYHFIFLLNLAALAACGLKVINPNDQNKNAGTKQLDLATGKIVSTHTCKLESIGNRFSGTGKTEEDARKEVLAQCQQRTTFSFCKPEKIKCVEN